jgi:16S rRNA processing protein RimM
VTGEVAVEVRTDSPELRFADGAALRTDPPERGPLTVTRTRWHAGRLLVRFAEVGDRTAAESLRGTLLTADSSTSPALDDPEEYWDHQLIGLAVRDRGGKVVGEVVDVLHPPGPPLLAVRRTGGEEMLVPFVAAIVPVVDVAAGHVVVDPPEGLAEL